MLRILVHGLARAGLEVHVATTDDNGAGRLDVPLGVPVVEDGVTFRYFARQTQFYKFSWPLTRWLRLHIQDYDLVHIHALFTYAVLPASFWAHHSGIPYVVRPLGTLNSWGMHNRRPRLKRLSLRLIERHILARADAIHYTSIQEKEQATASGIPQQHAIVIPNAIDRMPSPCASTTEALWTRLSLSPDQAVILFLSRIDPKKGLDLLLPAFARVRQHHSQARLVIAGSGDTAFTEALKKEAARLGIANEVIWAGFLTGADKISALSNADLFVLPSYSENFGIAVVEAMACGTPVVVTDQVAIHREISGAEAGLVTTCTVEALAQALSRLMDDAPLRNRMGDNGEKLAQGVFSIDRTRKKMIDLYTTIVKDHRTGQRNL